MWKRPQTIFGAIWSLLLLLREAIGLWGEWEFISQKAGHIWGVRQVVDFLTAPPPWFVFGSILSIIALFVWAYKTKNDAPERSSFSINIEPTTSPNQASESWLEWLHVEVAPPPGASPEILIAWSNLDSRVHDMRWRSDRGPVEETTARAERPSILPIAIRSQRGETIMGTPVHAGVCYLTEVNFQINHLATVRINAGVHQLFIMVRTRNNRDAMREFRLTVPPTLNEPLRLEPI
jgi:hypothetical protein